MLKEKLAFLLIIALFFLSCCGVKCDKEDRSFRKPQVINSDFQAYSQVLRDTVKYVSEVFPKVIGKYKFDQNIDVKKINQDTSFDKDFLFSISSRRIIDSLDVNGFELIPDYGTSIYYRDWYSKDTSFLEYYPLYLVNSTHSDKLFLAKDDYVYGIQEAQYKSRNYDSWYAIEGAGFDFCGNGSWGVIVHPQEFILILMKKYSGNYSTKIRVRVRIGESTYVSTAFDGMIDERQFTMDKGSYLFNKIKDSDGYFFSGLFYGAIPRWE
ncbi:hypothetical protein [Lewinella sp. LCG006]|uniref:hypothetical protein n=1 Tax=Lewinella sp. LCG006 TaxID=3231911 RepID=UPI003460AE2F